MPEGPSTLKWYTTKITNQNFDLKSRAKSLALPVFVNHKFWYKIVNEWTMKKGELPSREVSNQVMLKGINLGNSNLASLGVAMEERRRCSLCLANSWR